MGTTATKITHPRCRGGFALRRRRRRHRGVGRGGATSGGVFGHGTQEEDDPVTWEAHVSPRWSPGSRRPGDASPRTVRMRVACAVPRRRGTRIEVGTSEGKPELLPTETGESEGRIRARTSGNRVAPGPGRAKAARARVISGGTMSDASMSGDMSPELRKVAERAKQEPEGVFHSLAHLIDVPALERAYHRARKDAAVGVDGVTKERYGQDLEARLRDLHGRMKAKRYRHQSIRRIHIPKDGDRTRPIGVSAFEINWSRTSSARCWRRSTSRTSWTARTVSGQIAGPTTRSAP
jgi:hypothetical protein